jgi:hypothetical protein
VAWRGVVGQEGGGEYDAQIGGGHAVVVGELEQGVQETHQVAHIRPVTVGQTWATVPQRAKLVVQLRTSLNKIIKINQIEESAEQKMGEEEIYFIGRYMAVLVIGQKAQKKVLALVRKRLY